MQDERFQTNEVLLEGEIISDFSYHHTMFGEDFYMSTMAVERLSYVVDEIPIVVSKQFIDTRFSYIGKVVSIRGQFRSFNEHQGKRKLKLFVFVKEFAVLQQADAKNQIFLDGYICKEVGYRKTPLGRDIADLLMAVNRSYKRSDYIPCICWGRTAYCAEKLEVGTNIQIWGRIQSREYVKRLSDTEIEQRIAYEVSVGRLNVM